MRPPTWFEDPGTANVSWVFDATGLIWSGPNFGLNLDDHSVTLIAVNPANYSGIYSRYVMGGRPTN
jgi:hypothetical protein